MQITPYLGIREAAKQSGLSMYFWRHAVSDGKVPHVTSGKKIYVDYERAMSMIRKEITL